MVHWFFAELCQFLREKEEFHEGKIVVTALDGGRGMMG
jgi:hypothetical protein